MGNSKIKSIKAREILNSSVLLKNGQENGLMFSKNP